jgi:hypothetical protein
VADGLSGRSRRALGVSSVASLQPASVVFREEQYFDWRIYAGIAALELFIGLGLLRGHTSSLEFVAGVVIGLLLLMFMVVFFLHMTTEVTPTQVCVWFGWLPAYRRVVALEVVRAVEVVTYRPIVDYGGWGIRLRRDGDRALIARGNRGVRIELSDGSKLLIGSQRPEALAVAIDGAVRPGV